MCRALAIVFAALTVLNAIAPTSAFAADTDQQVKTVRVGWLVNNEGFQDGNPGERLSGWGYEYLQTLSYYTPGWKYEYVSGTFTELMDMLEAGEIDLVPNISYSEERAQKLLYSSNPEGTERYYIYAKPDRDDLAKGDPQALQGLTIGCNPGVMQTFVGQQWLTSEGITCTYKETPGSGDLFAALANDEVDAIIMNDTISSPSASPMFYVGSSDYYFAVPKSRPDLMDDINSAMAAINRDNPRYNDEVKSNYSAQNSGSASLTGDERAWLKANNNTVTLGYLTGKLPYCNENENGEMEGSLAALATTLHDKFGITVKTVAFENNEKLQKALTKGAVDVALPIYRDYWLAEQTGFIQSNSLGTMSITAIHAGSDLSKDLQSIACTNSSIVNRRVLESLYPTATITECKSGDEMFNALALGKVDSIIVPSSRMETIRDKHDIEEYDKNRAPEHRRALMLDFARQARTPWHHQQRHYQCRRIAFRKQLLLRIVHGSGIRRTSIPLSQPYRYCLGPYRNTVDQHHPAHLGTLARPNRAGKGCGCQHSQKRVPHAHEPRHPSTAQRHLGPYRN